MLNYFRVGPANFDLWSESGTAAGVKTWSETRVSGGGGGNNTHVSISSSVTTRNEFFLIEDGGKEHSSSLTGNIPVRDGQKATVVYVKRVSKGGGFPIYFKNHTSGDERMLNGLSILTGQSGCLMFILVLFACYVIGTFTVPILLGPRNAGIGSMLGVLAAIGLMVNRFITLKATRAALNQRARALGESGKPVAAETAA